jgi:hypothetical protein
MTGNPEEIQRERLSNSVLNVTVTPLTSIFVLEFLYDRFKREPVPGAERSKT